MVHIAIIALITVLSVCSCLQVDHTRSVRYIPVYSTNIGNSVLYYRSVFYSSYNYQGHGKGYSQGVETNGLAFTAFSAFSRRDRCPKRRSRRQLARAEGVWSASGRWCAVVGKAGLICNPPRPLLLGSPFSSDSIGDGPGETNNNQGGRPKRTRFCDKCRAKNRACRGACTPRNESAPTRSFFVSEEIRRDQKYRYGKQGADTRKRQEARV